MCHNSCNYINRFPLFHWSKGFLEVYFMYLLKLACCKVYLILVLSTIDTRFDLKELLCCNRFNSYR